MQGALPRRAGARQDANALKKPKPGALARPQSSSAGQDVSGPQEPVMPSAASTSRAYALAAPCAAAMVGTSLAPRRPASAQTAPGLRRPSFKPCLDHASMKRSMCVQNRISLLVGVSRHGAQQQVMATLHKT